MRVRTLSTRPNAMLSRRRATAVVSANWWDGGRLEQLVRYSAINPFSTLGFSNLGFPNLGFSNLGFSNIGSTNIGSTNLGPSKRSRDLGSL